MSELEIKNMRELDEAAEKAGGFVSSLPASESHYDYRGIIKYCREKNIEPLDLTIRELNQFVLSA